MKPRLLIVEDDDVLREVWRVVFSNRGWEVVVATTVAEGLSLLDPPPDYLILDLLLPDQGGEVILRRVRDADLKTRVAVTTAADDPNYLSEIRALHPDALFEKPVNVADVWREAG
jgi:two-component system alkaline phosphatase synthesis response regulator PhoP